MPTIPQLTSRILAQSRVIAEGNRIRDVRRLVETYGGNASTWVKKSSPRFGMGAYQYEYHWYEHPGIGRVELADIIPMIVKLRRKNARYPDLTPGLSYVVIGIEADDYRILNDRGCPYLYPSRLFKTIDSSKPHHWVTERGEEGESYAYPQPLNAAGFFEDFFDAKPKAVAAFWRIVNQRLVTANRARQRAASGS